MNTVLYNVGILMVIIGLLLMMRGRQAKGEVHVERFHIKGNEGFVLMVLGFLTMASASWT